MYIDKICKVCGKDFKGGPRAYYCPDCRVEKKREYNIKSKKRIREGKARTIGSIDVCGKCGEKYTVNGPSQRFCLDCRDIHYREYDRITSLEYYHENKDEINPARNKRRRIGTKICVICEKEFEVSTARITCSEKCREQRNKQMQKKWYNKKKLETKN